MRMRIAALLLVSCGLAAGCTARPHLRGQVTLHLMADRDFAQILLAHCETGVELGKSIASLRVSKEIASLGDAMRLNEENDRAALVAWIGAQGAQPTVVGDTEGAEVRSEHGKAIELLRSTDPTHLNEHALRLLVSHHDEELAVIRKTPLEDKNLRRIVEGIRRRLSDDTKALSRRLAATAS